MAVNYEYVKGEGWVPKFVPEIKCYRCNACGFVHDYALITHTIYHYDRIPTICWGKMLPVFL